MNSATRPILYRPSGPVDASAFTLWDAITLLLGRGLSIAAFALYLVGFYYVGLVPPLGMLGLSRTVLLAVSRAIGETMIVVMAAGLAANLTLNPLDAVTTVTVQIVTLLTGDQEFDSAKTLSAFALGLVLFVVTLVLNLAALRVVQRYRERYD